MRVLRQSTASQVILLGPFVDDTDFKTAETGLTIANTDINIRKHGGTSFTAKNSGGATHVASGWYHATLDATDTNTLGLLEVVVVESGALQVWKEFMVIPAHAYDSLVANANGPAILSGIIDTGTAQSAASTSITLRAAFSATDDVLIGATVWVYSSTNGLHDRRVITDWDNTTKVATVDAWTQDPTGTILYAVYATAPGSTSDPLPVDVQTWLGTAPNALASGRVDTTVGAMQANVVTAAAVATGAIDADAVADGAIDAGAIADGAIDAATFAAGAIDAAAIADGAIDAATFAANAIAAAALDPDVTTELQSGLATSAELAAVETKIDTLDTNVDTLLTADAVYKKNVAVTAFMFYMALTDGSPGESLTVAATISKDGGAFAAVAGAVAEVSDGWYKHNLSQTEMNADEIALKYTATGAAQRNIKIRTQA